MYIQYVTLLHSCHKNTEISAFGSSGTHRNPSQYMNYFLVELEYHSFRKRPLQSIMPLVFEDRYLTVKIHSACHHQNVNNMWNTLQKVLVQLSAYKCSRCTYYTRSTKHSIFRDSYMVSNAWQGLMMSAGCDSLIVGCTTQCPLPDCTLDLRTHATFPDHE